MRNAILSYRNHRYILTSPICLIGRDSDCDLVLDDLSVSRKHAVVLRGGNSYMLLDYKSANGAFLNDEALVNKAELQHGDRIRLGDEVLTFQLESHFKFGPEVKVDNYEGLLTTDDFQKVLEEALADLAVERRDRYDFVFDFDVDLRESSTSAEIIDRGLHRLLNALRADRGFLALFDEEAGEMDVRACEGLEASTIPTNPFYCLLMKEALVNGKLISTTEALFEYFYQEPRLIFLGVGSALCAPLLRLGQPCGVVYMDRSMVAQPFRPNDARLLAIFDYRLSLSLEGSRLLENLKDNLQQVDILTTRIGEGGSQMKCEICGDPIDRQAMAELVMCQKCHTIHHRDCWVYNRGCPIYGCHCNQMKTLDEL